MKALYVSSILGKSYKILNSARCYASEAPSIEILHNSSVKPELLKANIGDDLNKFPQFDTESVLDMQKMFDARIWYGHKMGTLKPNMKWALYGERLGTCVFDLNITKQHFEKALTFLSMIAYRGGMVLFVSSNRQTMHLVERKAKEVGEYAHTRKWTESNLTNIKQLFGAPLRLPDMIIFLSTLTSTLEKHPGIVEAAKLTIPTIGIVDSNSEPNYITFPIPGNDDSVQSVEFYMDAFCKAIQHGKHYRELLQS
ncbi:unnamed protein product [Bursaphelenchus okinawaensis]|uniref:Small ribosomal subunit protein uS2m n=1 Tax=Bursaphelenchus okinawaensis TaxID=465554 RepID=A0A811LD88_9BILA|nr:unnamed protein product [Bursaphelenchus okinawaensis]CAG9120407.1 unnamed protein product [Bursaphelenchus okinawaensis]